MDISSDGDTIMATTVGDGAWSHVSDILGLANRNGRSTDLRYDNGGFRCVSDVE